MTGKTAGQYPEEKGYRIEAECKVVFHRRLIKENKVKFERRLYVNG